MKDPVQVVFIMTDTQRFDMLGCYGNPDMKTPCLDRLAGQGLRFDRAYTCQPVCGPARAAIFTGTWPHTNGCWGNDMAIGNTIRTLGQQLHAQDIAAAYIGKWHLDHSDYFGRGQAADGWDPAYWYDMRNYLEELSPADRVRSRNMQTNRDPALTADFTFGHRCSNRAIDFLKNHQGNRFCLVLSYDEPHHPFLCPKPFAQMYRDYHFPKSPNVYDTLLDKPEHHRVWAGLRSNPETLSITIPDFLGCNSFVDDEIGRVLTAIDQYAPNALVIYTSDHGDGLFAHGLSGKGPAMYDEIARIPLIVRWPGHTPAGVVCTHPMSHIDLTPTILDAFGIAPAKITQGRSMIGAYHSPTQPPHAAIFIEFGRYEVDHDGFGGFQPVRAAFDGRYKLIVNLLTTDELYDTQHDPAEMTNLIASPEHAAARNALHNRLLDWMNQTRDPFRGYYWQRRPWRTDAAPATWSYTGMTRQLDSEHGEPRWLDYGNGLEITALVRQK